MSVTFKVSFDYPMLYTSIWLQETTDGMNGFNFFYFLTNKGRYVRRDTDSLFPPDKGQELSGCKLFAVRWCDVG